MHSGQGVRPPTQMKGVRLTLVPPPKKVSDILYDVRSGCLQALV